MNIGMRDRRARLASNGPLQIDIAEPCRQESKPFRAGAHRGVWASHRYPRRVGQAEFAWEHNGYNFGWLGRI